MTSPLTVLVAIYSPFAAWNMPARYVDRLRGEFPGDHFLHASTEAEALALVPQADVVFTAELRPAHLAAARRLRWVHSPAAGVGGILFPGMVQSPVVLTNSRGISAETIAEHVVAVTLALFRKLPLTFSAQAAHDWAQDAVLAGAPLRLIAGSDALVVGLGAIGRAAAQRFHALGARVTGIRRRASEPPPAGVDRVAPPDQLLDLLAQTDIVVLATPQTAATTRLIGVRELAAMRSAAVLVNVGRGPLVDEAALVSALTRAPGIGGAALDVFVEEPLPRHSPLWDLPNVVITPHVAGFRPEHWEAVTTLFAGNLRRFEAGLPLENLVDKHAGY